MDTIAEVEEAYVEDDQLASVTERLPSSPVELTSARDEIYDLADLADREIRASSDSPLVRRARKLLYRRFRVGVEDGRFFVGKFHCLDKQGNIILFDTVEYRQITPNSSSDDVNVNFPGTEQRSLGLVLIPSRCRTSCHVECSLYERLSLLSIDQ